MSRQVGMFCSSLCAFGLALAVISPMSAASAAAGGVQSGDLTSGGVSGSQLEPGVAGKDTRPPTAPSGLVAFGVTGSGVNLTWTASRDDVGVTGYDLYAGSTPIRSVVGTAATVSGLATGTTYTLTVRARDAAGNLSRASNAVRVTIGRMKPSDYVVFGFSQSDVGPNNEDPQVSLLSPDINIRAFQKWSVNGLKAGDYDFAQIARYHQDGVALVGGGTVSVIFPQEFPGTGVFDDMSTRDADNVPVPHEEVVPGARRGNLFNPKYRAYLLDWAKLQIDGGVDGLFFDEVTGGFSGGTAHQWNGDEGFDDYTIADFNRYLLAKYPTFTAADWKSRFGMTDDNILRRDVPAGDLTHNFNYRTYLQTNGWDQDPLNAANPLESEWGRVTSNRMYAEDTSFTGTYTRKYWEGMVDDLRAYARNSAHRQILITSNGLYPYVDLDSVGLYTWNPDEQTPDGKGADYVPVVDGHLNGAKSLQANYRYLKEQSARISGGAPVVVFIDWPTDMMTAYLHLPLTEQEDYWRIFGAEAYANGIFPAFHLADTVGDPTAQQQGILDFFRSYSQFYKDHRSLFRENDPATVSVNVEASQVSASVLVQRGTGTRTVHLVNHNYDQAIQPQTNLGVDVALGSCPRQVTLVSPDSPGTRTPSFSCQAGTVHLTVDRLDYYDVLVLR